MTGDDGMEVLDLDMELDEHALRVFQLHSQPWLKARLQFYKEKSDALWRRRRNGTRHRNRGRASPRAARAPPSDRPPRPPRWSERAGLLIKASSRTFPQVDPLLLRTDPACGR